MHSDMHARLRCLLLCDRYAIYQWRDVYQGEEFAESNDQEFDDSRTQENNVVDQEGDSVLRK